MKGLALISTDPTQVVVESKKAAVFNPPSGNHAHARVAQAAMASSVAIPAATTLSLWLRSVSFQTSLVSV